MYENQVDLDQHTCDVYRTHKNHLNHLPIPIYTYLFDTWSFRYYFESLDRTLQEIIQARYEQAADRLFNGKSRWDISKKFWFLGKKSHE